jgi:hypothetical protein
MGGSYEEFEMLLSQDIRFAEKNHFSTFMRGNFPKNSPIPYSDLSGNYLVKRYQDRHNYNKPTKICQKGLEKRIENKRIKEMKRTERIIKEQKIKKAFKRT